MFISLYSFCGGLQAGAMSPCQAAPPPPSPLVSRAFPFLMTGKVQPLSFTSSEDSGDRKEYDDIKWYSVCLNIIYFLIFLVSFHYPWYLEVQEYQ